MQGESLAHAIFKFESGKTASYQVTVLGDTSFMGTKEPWFRVIGTRGEIVIDGGFTGEATLLTKESEEAQTPSPSTHIHTDTLPPLSLPMSFVLSPPLPSRLLRLRALSTSRSVLPRCTAPAVRAVRAPSTVNTRTPVYAYHTTHRHTLTHVSPRAATRLRPFLLSLSLSPTHTLQPRSRCWRRVCQAAS